MTSKMSINFYTTTFPAHYQALTLSSGFAFGGRAEPPTTHLLLNLYRWLFTIGNSFVIIFLLKIYEGETL